MIVLDKATTEQQFKYNQIISSLESGNYFSDDDYIWLKENIKNVKHYNHVLHFFLFYIDWQPFYTDVPLRMTVYDIIFSNKCKKDNTRRKQIVTVCAEFRKLFNGELKSQEDLSRAKELILNRLSNGLKSLEFYNNKLNFPSGYKSKGIHEIVSMIFEYIATDPYIDKDFAQAYLNDLDFRSLLNKKLYYFFVAFKTAIVFNNSNKQLIVNNFSVSIDNFFALHVFLRHTVPYKFLENYQPTENLSDSTIKNGLKVTVNITAHKDVDGSISIISKDGNFHIPNFSPNNIDYCNYLAECKSGKVQPASIDEISTSFYNKLKPIIDKLVVNINSNFSPNIIYFEGEMFGVEINKNVYREKRIIEIGSFYPINSEWQIKSGISNKDYKSIVNQLDIPCDFIIKRTNK